MIKCNVTVCGTVSKAATCRTNKEGKPFVSFAINVVIPAKSGMNKTIEVSVIKDGTMDETDMPIQNQLIEVTGTLIPRKRGEAMYYNLTASDINHEPAEAEDCIKGELELRGKVGKKIDEKTDKKGIPYCQFSAFSAEKVHDGFEYVCHPKQEGSVVGCGSHSFGGRGETLRHPSHFASERTVFEAHTRLRCMRRHAQHSIQCQSLHSSNKVVPVRGNFHSRSLPKTAQVLGRWSRRGSSGTGPGCC